jgi:hypothetical protein
LVLSECGQEVLLCSIHLYRSARDYFVDGIYWGDDEEGVMLYLRVKGVPPDEITKALEQIAQEGTSMLQHECMDTGIEERWPCNIRYASMPLRTCPILSKALMGMSTVPAINSSRGILHMPALGAHITSSAGGASVLG